MKTAVVTGATGFIGKALTKKLLDIGFRVYAVGTCSERLNEFKISDEMIILDYSFEDYYKLKDEIDNDVDVWFHLAWDGVFGKSFEDYKLQIKNIEFSCEVINIAKKLNCKKFIFAGTKNEYATVNHTFSNKTLPLRYTYLYGSAKLAANMMCKTIASNSNIQYNSTQIGMVYGENNYSKMLPNVIISQINNKTSPKLITGNYPYDLVYIDDVVEAFIAIMEKGINLKSYYVGHRDLKTFKELVTELRDVIDPSVELMFGEYPEEIDDDYAVINLDALYSDTGFECKADFEESILKTAQWIKKVGI